MALLGMDGFDRQTTVGRAGITSAWSNAQYFPGRRGGLSVGGTAVFIATYLTPATAGPFVLGFAFKSTLNSSDESDCVVAITNSTLTCQFQTIFRNNGAVQLYIGALGTIPITSATGFLQPNVWHYVEIKISVADTGGVANIRVDGQDAINYVGDTLRGSGTTIDRINLNHVSAQPARTDQFDDMYWLDGTGAAPYNDFLGDVRIQTLLPNAPGATTQLTPTPSGPNWDCVNETPPSATDYVFSSTIGQRDTYAHTDLGFTASTGRVFAVQPLALAVASDTGAAKVSTVTRNAGGTLRKGTATSLSTTATWVSGGVQTTDPSSAAWTKDSVNSTEFGVEVA